MFISNSTIYLCQLWNIAVPFVSIVGDKEIFVKSGSSVTIKCLISNCLEKPSYVFWYYEDNFRILDDDDRIPEDLLLAAAAAEAASKSSPDSSGFKSSVSGQDRRRLPGKLGKVQQRRKKQHQMVLLESYLEEIRRNRSQEDNGVESIFASGGIDIETQALHDDGTALSTITIKDPTSKHSGTYSCRPANLDPAKVKLHVIQGTLMAYNAKKMGRLALF